VSARAAVEHSCLFRQSIDRALLTFESRARRRLVESRWVTSGHAVSRVASRDHAV